MNRFPAAFLTVRSMSASPASPAPARHARTHALTACVADLAAVSAARDTVVKVLDSSCVRSSTPAGPAGLARGAGAEPNPTYLPPWLGGRWSGLDAFSCKGAGQRLLMSG